MEEKFTPRFLDQESNLCLLLAVDSLPLTTEARKSSIEGYKKFINNLTLELSNSVALFLWYFSFENTSHPDKQKFNCI